VSSPTDITESAELGKQTGLTGALILLAFAIRSGWRKIHGGGPTEHLAGAIEKLAEAVKVRDDVVEIKQAIREGFIDLKVTLTQMQGESEAAVLRAELRRLREIIAPGQRTGGFPAQPSPHLDATMDGDE
jgi:hypothetical protein